MNYLYSFIFIVTCATLPSLSLQAMFKIKEGYNPYRIIPGCTISRTAEQASHDFLVHDLKMRSANQLQELFDEIEVESWIKMAIRLIATVKHYRELDNLACKYFVYHKKIWINGSGHETTALFSQQNLPHILPILEAVLEEEVIKLNLTFNQLTDLPAQIGLLTNLEQLYLYGNNLTKLPEEIGKLKRLVVLNLACNDITELPEVICQLKKLRFLIVDEHVKIPQELENRSSLKIRRCTVKKVPWCTFL